MSGASSWSGVQGAYSSAEHDIRRHIATGVKAGTHHKMNKLVPNNTASTDM